MAYTPISGYTLQTVTQGGEVASGYYLKFYEANTTTPLSMATDSSGGTLLVKAKLNDNGMPISNPLDNSTIFVPHMNANYRLVVYKNETDADNNTTASSYVNIPNILKNFSSDEIGSLATAGANYGKNLIINGDFSIWQRGTSTTTDGEFQADRFFMTLSGATGTYSRQTHTIGQTDVPGNPKYFARFAMSAGNNNSGFVHRVENVATTSNREVTLSFYAKGTNPGGGSFAMGPSQNFGTGGSPSSTVGNTSLTGIIVTSSWQKFTHTFTPDSITGKTLGTNNNDYLQLYFNQPNTDTSTDAWTLDISNVQLEFGDVATDFEYVTPADQLDRCQRYYAQTSSTHVDNVYAHYNSTQRYSFIHFPRTMRAAPAVTQTITNMFENGANITGTVTADNVANIVRDGFDSNATNSVTTNQGGAALVYLQWTADAEL